MNEPNASSLALSPEQLSRKARCDFSRVGLALFIMGVLTTVVQLIFSLLPGWWPAFTNSGWYFWFATFAPLYLVGMPAAVLLLRRVPADVLPTQKLRPGSYFVAFVMCISILYVGSWVGALLSYALSRGAAQNPLDSYVSTTTFFSVLVTIVLAPVLEELIFRKLLIDRLARYGGAVAVVASGLCFGLFHMNLYQFFYAAGLGMLFGYLYLRTGKLWYTVSLHMLVNFVGSVLPVFIMGLVDQSAFSGLDLSDTQAVMDAVLPQLPRVLILLFYELALFALVIGGAIALFFARKKFVFPRAQQQLPHAGRVAFCNIGMLLFIVFCLVVIVLNIAVAYL